MRLILCQRAETPVPQPPSHYENAILLDRFTRDPVAFRFWHGLGATRDRAWIQPAIGGPFHSVGAPVAVGSSDAEFPACTVRAANADLPSGTIGPADVELPSGPIGSPDADLPSSADDPADADISALGSSSGTASGDAASQRLAEHAASNAAECEAEYAAADAGTIHPASDAFPDPAERDPVHAPECNTVHAAGVQAIGPAGLHDYAAGDS